jgi:tyrosinase
MKASEADLDAGIVFGVGALQNDEIRARLDVDVMISKQPDTFNLFLLALMDLRQDSSKLGYFQLAGIHGLPTGLWDGVGKNFADNFSGYCAHGRLIFPTWHRPYIALLEQEIYRRMLRIVKEYDPLYQSKYRTAARAFRFPYWDYFRPRDVDARFPGIKYEGRRTRFEYDFRMPDIFNVKEVMLRLPPHDRLEPRGNPLYNFRFSEKFNLDRDWARAKLNVSV